MSAKAKRRGARRGKKCNTKNCRNRAAVRPDGRSYGGKCHKCRSRQWRTNSPMRAAYLRLKSHAGERGIPFTIPFGYFEFFAEKSELIGNQGCEGDALTVDRIDNLRGYVKGNIQIMTRLKNTEKRNKVDEIRNKAGFKWMENYF